MFVMCMLYFNLHRSTECDNDWVQGHFTTASYVKHYYVVKDLTLKSCRGQSFYLIVVLESLPQTVEVVEVSNLELVTDSRNTALFSFLSALVVAIRAHVKQIWHAHPVGFHNDSKSVVIRHC